MWHWEGWGRSELGWRKSRVGQAERRWRTWLGDGHNVQQCKAAHGECSAKADEAWWIDTTVIGGRCRQLLWMRYKVPNGRREGSGICHDANWRCGNNTCTNNVWRGYGDSWYHPLNISNAASNLSTRKYLYDTRFQNITVALIHRISPARCGVAWFITNEDNKACSIRKLLPLHTASVANCHIEIGYGQNQSWCLMQCWSNWYPHCHFWQWIRFKSILRTNFAMCQLLVEFSDQIMCHDDSSVHVEGTVRAMWRFHTLNPVVRRPTDLIMSSLLLLCEQVKTELGTTFICTI